MTNLKNDIFRHDIFKHAIFKHGGNIDAAQAVFPNAMRPWIDLSTGISPWNYNPIDIDFNCLKNLPQQSEIKSLEAIAAAYYGCDEHEIIAVGGSDIAIRLLGQILRNEPQSIRLLLPIFSGHLAAFDYAEPLELWQLNQTKNATIVFANPNNPDGRFLEPNSLNELAFKNNLCFVIDEAFGDVEPNNSLVSPNTKNIILRSFGKFFGLAGLRLGFVIADKNIIAVLSKLLGDWQISSAAVQIGIKALSDKDWQLAQIKRIKLNAQRLLKLFNQYNLDIVGNGWQFVTIKTPYAMELFNHFGQSGILVRPFSYEPTWLRFGLPENEAAWQRLEDSFANFASFTNSNG